MTAASLPRVALAQAPPAVRAPSATDQQRALRLKKQGDDAMDSLRYGEALAAYTEAFNLTRDPALLFNKGRAHEALGRFSEALVELEAFNESAPPALKAKLPGLVALINDVRAHVSTVTFITNVRGAEIVVRNTVIGTAPLAGPVKVSSGRAPVDVRADGYLPYHQDADLPGGGEITIDAKLTPKDTSGVLVVHSEPPNADVSLDDRPVGSTPIERRVDAGTHALVVRHDGYRTSETSTVVGVGERKEISIPLEKTPSLLTRWWFWTGVGVVVVGGVALTAALLTEKSPTKGDIPPGQISGPLMRF